jgi:pyrroloquinoline quinone (PQQ) biosynthesis protein C
MHGVIRASVPLMEFAAYRCDELAERDPVAGPLRRYLTAHIAEERGHDDWLLADLVALGCDPAPVLVEQPPPAVARLVGAHYYWVAHHHPVEILGYIAVMEGNAPAVPLARWIVSHAGVPDAAVRTVREHAELDGGHTDAVFDLLDTLPLSAAQVHAVTISGLYTVEALIELFTHIARAQWREPPDASPRKESET